MRPEEKKSLSKFMSLVLRHQPETIGLELDAAGWVEVDLLIAGAGRAGRRIDREMLDEVVRTNDKQRFSLSQDGRRIRANQGHSVPVELGYEPSIPPDVLYHGTPQRYVNSILAEGLKRQKRHHVHLHPDCGVATDVGRRRGSPVLLVVDAAAMHQHGFTFFVTPNQVWLTDQVPAEFLRVLPYP